MEHENFSIKIKYDENKTKTFTTERDANRFLGTHIPGMNCSQVTPELYYEFNRHEFWDDGDTVMTGEEWAKVATALLSNFY